MNYGFKIREDAALDCVSLGALVHRLDPGIIPFRKASDFHIHVSGGEFNVAANLADCFRLNTGVATAMVDYPVGNLIAETNLHNDATFYTHDGLYRVVRTTLPIPVPKNVVRTGYDRMGNQWAS